MSGTITGNYPGQTAVKRLWKNIVGAFVKKENGKGLSTEDYTTAEKNKLENMQEISGIQRNGTDLTPNVSTKKVNVEVPILGVQVGGVDLVPLSDSKKVNVPVDNALSSSSNNPVRNSVIKDALDLKAPLASPAFTGNPTVPTQSTSDDSTKAASTAFVKAAITAALSGKIDLRFDFTYNSKASLPSPGVVGTFYFIPATNSETGVDEFEEFIWNSSDSRYERVGAAKVDLSGYVQTSNYVEFTTGDIDALVAEAETELAAASA